LSYRKPTTTSKGPAKAGAKAKPSASEAKPIKVRKGEKVAVVLSGGKPAHCEGGRGERGSESHKGTEPIEGAVPAGMRSREQATGTPASRLIDQRIRDLGGWRGETLARMRALILEADPEMTEE